VWKILLASVNIENPSLRALWDAASACPHIAEAMHRDCGSQFFATLGNQLLDSNFLG
jgi:hypothetical protein